MVYAIVNLLTKIFDLGYIPITLRIQVMVHAQGITL